jgi:hypothetical protein
VTVVSLTFSAGCGRKEKVVEAGAEDTPAAEAAGATGGGRLLQVVLTGNSIQMSGAVPPGLTRFHVRNLSQEAHSFAILGNAGRNQLGDELPPAESADLAVVLSEGRYVVFCPLRGHSNEPGHRLVVTKRAD